MTIINYFEQAAEEQLCLRQQLLSSDWRAAHYLYSLLNEGKFLEKYGKTTRLFMLVEDRALMAFCTLAEQDEIETENMKPWIGFVYTYPESRGKRYSEKLIDHACNIAKADGRKQVYLSSDEVGLYEKYGFEFIGNMKTIWDEETQVFTRILI